MHKLLGPASNGEYVPPPPTGGAAGGRPGGWRHGRSGRAPPRDRPAARSCARRCDAATLLALSAARRRAPGRGGSGNTTGTFAVASGVDHRLDRGRRRGLGALGRRGHRRRPDHFLDPDNGFGRVPASGLRDALCFTIDHWADLVLAPRTPRSRCCRRSPSSATRTRCRSRRWRRPAGSPRRCAATAACCFRARRSRRWGWSATPSTGCRH